MQNVTIFYSGSLRWNSSKVWVSIPAADLCKAVWNVDPAYITAQNKLPSHTLPAIASRSQQQPTYKSDLFLRYLDLFRHQFPPLQPRETVTASQHFAASFSPEGLYSSLGDEQTLQAECCAAAEMWCLQNLWVLLHSQEGKLCPYHQPLGVISCQTADSSWGWICRQGQMCIDAADQ